MFNHKIISVPALLSTILAVVVLVYLTVDSSPHRRKALLTAPPESASSATIGSVHTFGQYDGKQSTRHKNGRSAQTTFGFARLSRETRRPRLTSLKPTSGPE